MRDATIGELLNIAKDMIQWISDRIRSTITKQINNFFSDLNRRIENGWNTTLNMIHKFANAVSEMWNGLARAAGVDPAVAAVIVIAIPIIVIISWKVSKGGL